MTQLGTGLAAPKIDVRIAVLAWSGMESSCRQVLSLLFFFGTVRFISPADLGVFSLGVALMGLFAIVIDEPIAEALVQQHAVVTSDWDTGYSINLAIAALCLLLACVASPILADLLHQPSLVLVIPALTASSLVGALGNIHKSHLSRSLKFRTIAQTALLAQVIAGVASLGAAAAGFGYWALVLNVLSAAIVTSVVYRLVCAWKPRLRINTDIVRARAPYVGYSIAIRSLYLLRDQSLFVVAGSVGDLKTIGYLSLAMRVARALSQLFEEVTSRPLISLISRQQNDLKQFGDVLKTVLQITGLVALPSFVGLSELGTPLINKLLGSQWAPAGHFLPWICVGLGGWLFLHVIAVALRALGLGHLAFKLVAPAIFVDVGIFALAALVGFDWALKLWAARTVLSFPALILVVSRSLGVSVSSLVRIWSPPAIASGLMLLVLRWFDGNQILLQNTLGLLELIAAAAAVYGCTLLVMVWRPGRHTFLTGTFRR